MEHMGDIWEYDVRGVIWDDEGAHTVLPIGQRVIAIPTRDIKTTTMKIPVVPH